MQFDFSYKHKNGVFSFLWHKVNVFMDPQLIIMCRKPHRYQLVI